MISIKVEVTNLCYLRKKELNKAVEGKLRYWNSRLGVYAHVAFFKSNIYM